MARVLIVGMLVLALIVGAGMYYLQVYAYYEDVTAEVGDITLPVALEGGDPLVVPFTNFRGIDSTSSPLRYRACFDTDISMITLAATAQALPFVEPRVAPGWFDCFDAAQLGADLENGDATAYLSIPNIEYGIDRVVAFYPDGRGYIWHEINPCGEAVFNRNPAPENCPEPPESLQ